MKFYDRENEIEALKQMRQQSLREARMTVMMGRRRVGKTELLLHCGDENALYFFVARKTEAMLCQDFVREVEAKLGQPAGWPSNFGELFRFLLIQSEQRPITLIIDEFQDFQKVNPTIFSEMQREWDLHKAASNMHLIISGSVFSMMKRIFEDAGEPLFGRANQTIRLNAFTTDVLKEILHDHNPHYTPDDLLALFATTGGVAWYVSLMMDGGKNSRRKMLDYLTEPNSPFIHEGRNLLVEEFGSEHSVYFSILACIAGGQVSRGEIEGMIGTSNIGPYLVRLENYFHVIEKTLPLFSRPDAKKVRYKLCDNFLIIWFRFFFKYQAYIENGALGQLSRIIARDYDTFSGLALERYFETKFRESGRYTHIGKFWDRKGGNEIDLVAVNEIDGVAEIYEVKRDISRYSEETLRKKTEYLLANCRPLSGMEIRIAPLTLADM